MSIRAMPATTATAVASLEMVSLCKDVLAIFYIEVLTGDELRRGQAPGGV